MVFAFQDISDVISPDWRHVKATCEPPIFAEAALCKNIYVFKLQMILLSSDLCAACQCFFLNLVYFSLKVESQNWQFNGTEPSQNHNSLCLILLTSADPNP